MFVHLVLFKWKEDVSKQEMDKVFHEIRAMKHKCTGIMGFRTGENFSDYGHGYTHGLVVSFKEKKNLNEYMAHPDHEKILESLEALTEDILAVDFEDDK